MFLPDRKYQRCGQGQPPCLPHQLCYRSPIKYTEQHRRALRESQLVTPVHLCTELASYEPSEPLGKLWSFYGQVLLCPRQQCERCPAMEVSHRCQPCKELHCYLTLPDALVLLLAVTGTKFPLVPLVVLAAEPFTTI